MCTFCEEVGRIRRWLRKGSRSILIAAAVGHPIGMIADEDGCEQAPTGVRRQARARRRGRRARMARQETAEDHPSLSRLQTPSTPRNVLCIRMFV